MGLHVFAQVVLAAEALLADVADVLLHAGVNGFDVASEVGLVVELFGTEFAFVGLVLGLVAAQVGGVHLFGLEAFTAFLTTERILTGMETFVVLRQIAVLGELLVALQAFDAAGRQSGASIGGQSILVHGISALAFLGCGRCGRTPGGGGLLGSGRDAVW